MRTAVSNNAPAEGSSLPGSRPLRLREEGALAHGLGKAIAAGDGVAGAHCIHELWMRGALAVNIESALERLWKSAGASIPAWLPMRHIEWLGTAYDVSARFCPRRRGRSNIYLVLLDYRDSRPDDYGVYVGETRLPIAARFDQHKAGIRAAGSVLKRGLELLPGPVLHLQSISRADALDIEGRLAEALRAEGLLVQGGH
jgi:hypothetical protein